MNNVHIRSVFSTHDFIVEQNGLRSGYFFLSNQLNPYQWNILCRYLASTSDSLVFQIFCIGNWDERRRRRLLCVRLTGHISESLDTWDTRRSTHWSWASTRSIPLVDTTHRLWTRVGMGSLHCLHLSKCYVRQNKHFIFPLFNQCQSRSSRVKISFTTRIGCVFLYQTTPVQLLPVVTPVPDSLSHPIPRGNCRLYMLIVQYTPSSTQASKS